MNVDHWEHSFGQSCENGFKLCPPIFRWLCNESLPPTSRRWAVEGLAYLTFDADVKEDLVQDKNALLGMCELAKVWLLTLCFQLLGIICSIFKLKLDLPFFHFALVQSDDKTVLFAVGSTLVNCTNSYDAEKPDPQLVELAKYAKQHVPEEHPKVIFKSCPLRLYLSYV